MITVIIPTLNEEDNIASVVSYARSQDGVTEVLVIDDKSIDATVSQARESGARVITSTQLGKGASMREGVMLASNPILVFLDGDIDPYPSDTIRLLTQPIINGECEFVKSSFSRNAGRVTELVAKPLLSIFFKDLLHFEQPLSGMIAGKKAAFEKLNFRDDYGVDIGILIDMHLNGVTMKDVRIGYIENKSKPWHALGKMSKEVAQAIISKAASTSNPNYNFEVFGAISEIRSQMEFAVEDQLSALNKLIVFDMDNTLLKGRFIDTFFDKYGMTAELALYRTVEKDPIIRSKHIATRLKGYSYQEMMEVTESIPIVEGIGEVIAELKKRDYIIGIISDSYDCVTNYIKNKLGIDFALANELEFSRSICTGEIKIPSFFFNHPGSICKHVMCKTNAMLSVIEKYGIRRENCIAIGDSLNDLCMIREAGLGIAFCTQDPILNHHADVVIEQPSFDELLTLAR